MVSTLAAIRMSRKIHATWFTMRSSSPIPGEVMVEPSGTWRPTFTPLGGTTSSRVEPFTSLLAAIPILPWSRWAPCSLCLLRRSTPSWRPEKSTLPSLCRSRLMRVSPRTKLYRATAHFTLSQVVTVPVCAVAPKVDVKDFRVARILSLETTFTSDRRTPCRSRREGRFTKLGPASARGARPSRSVR